MRGLARSAVIVSLLGLSLAGCSAKEPQSARPARSGQEAEIPKHPLYAGYRFGGAGAIDLGSQPLTLPEASVAELLSRDAVLASRLEKTGVQLKLFPFYKGKDINYFLSKGNLEGGFFADMPAITAAATGDVVIVALLKQGFASIISRKPLLVKDLKGKRVATGLGSAAHFTLLSALENEGMSERDIKLEAMEVSDMPQALSEGSIDAFSAWEPTPVMTFAAHPEFHLVHKGLSYGFLCLRRDFVTAHPAETREIAAAVARACFWMRLPGNLDRVARWTGASATTLLGRPYPLQPARMIALTRSDLLNTPSSPRIPDSLLSEEGLLYKKFTFLKRAGKIPEATPWARVRASFDSDMLRQVMAGGDEYALQDFDYRGPQDSDGAK